MTPGLAEGLSEAFTGLGVVLSTGAALVEGVALFEVKMLGHSQNEGSTARRVARYALTGVALAAACSMTGGAMLTVVAAFHGMGEGITLLAMGFVGLATSYGHYQAFQWAFLPPVNEISA